MRHNEGVRIPVAARQLLALVAAFVVVTAIAAAAGAANFGTALTFGTMAFCVTFVVLMARGR